MDIEKRIEKLPQWAQDHIEHLESKIRDLECEVSQLTEEYDSLESRYYDVLEES